MRDWDVEIDVRLMDMSGERSGEKLGVSEE